MDPFAAAPAAPGDALAALRRNWGWFVVLGIALVLVGLIAISATFITALAVVWVLGVLLLVGGILEVVNAVQARGWRGVVLHLLTAILYLIVGVFLVRHTGAGVAALTLFLAVALLIGGAFRIVMALLERFPGWGWVLLNGVISFILGLLIWQGWPESKEWVIGLFFGIEMLFSGWSWVMLGVAVRSAVPR
jgi:uncharacterized membrane protein HdeD (DUF308 family)